MSMDGEAEPQAAVTDSGLPGRVAMAGSRGAMVGSGNTQVNLFLSFLSAINTGDGSKRRFARYVRGRRVLVALSVVCFLAVFAGVAAVVGASGSAPAVSQSAVLKRLVSRSQYLAATSSYAVEVTYKNHSLLPSIILGDSATIHGQGTDSAYVAFGSLTTGDVKADANSETIFLPKPVIAAAVLDLDKCYITSQRGILTAFEQLANYDPNSATPLYLAAESAIHAKAEQEPGLMKLAEQQTSSFLVGFLAQFHFTKITVSFV